MIEACAKILLVDDDRQTRLKLGRSLEAQGHTVTAADGGQTALDILATEPFDVILLDILMPEMDGFEVLQTLKANARLSDIPVIVVSALEDAESEEKCKRLGAHVYMTKSVDPGILNARINECLDQGK